MLLHYTIFEYGWFLWHIDETYKERLNFNRKILVLNGRLATKKNENKNKNNKKKNVRIIPNKNLVSIIPNRFYIFSFIHHVLFYLLYFLLCFNKQSLWL